MINWLKSFLPIIVLIRIEKREDGNYVVQLFDIR